MDPDDFDHVNGTYGDVKYAEAWGNPIAIAKAKEQAEHLQKRAIYEAITLLKKHGYHVTPPDAPTHEVPRK